MICHLDLYIYLRHSNIQQIHKIIYSLLTPSSLQGHWNWNSSLVGRNIVCGCVLSWNQFVAINFWNGFHVFSVCYLIVFPKEKQRKKNSPEAKYIYEYRIACTKWNHSLLWFELQHAYSLGFLSFVLALAPNHYRYHSLSVSISSHLIVIMTRHNIFRWKKKSFPNENEKV